MEKMRLENLECFISDGNYSSKYPRNDEFLDEGVPFIRCNNFKNNTIIKKEMYYISKEKHATLLKGHVKEGDILITTRGSLGEVAIVPKEYENANINAQIVLLRVNSEKIYNRYLMWELKSPNVQNQIIRNKTGTTLQQLPINRLKGIEISLEKDIQKQISIANKLDKIQEIIETRKRQIEELDQLIKSQFVKMFQNNEKCNLCEIAEITMGQSPNSDTYNDEGKGIPFFQGKADFQDVYVKIKHYCTKPKKIAKEGDTLISVRAPVGDVNITLIECCIGRGLASIRPKKNYSTTWFLFYALKSIKKEIESKGTGSTFKAINKEILYKLQLPKVEIDRQNEFVKLAEQIDEQKIKLQKSLGEMKKLQESLMDKYFGE